MAGRNRKEVFFITDELALDCYRDSDGEPSFLSADVYELFGVDVNLFGSPQVMDATELFRVMYKACVLKFEPAISGVDFWYDRTVERMGFFIQFSPYLYEAVEHTFVSYACPDEDEDEDEDEAA